MSYLRNIGTIRVTLVQASDYVAGGSCSAVATVDILARSDDGGRTVLSGRSTLDRGSLELADGIPEGFMGELEYALDEYMAVSLDPETYVMGRYGIMYETGGRLMVNPPHDYRLVVYAYGTPSDPEFRFVPVQAVTREECRAECEAEGMPAWR